MSETPSNTKDITLEPFSFVNGEDPVMTKMKEDTSSEKSPADAEKGEIKPPATLTGIRFALVFVGLMLSVFLAALDLTIVATTLNAVGNEFQAYTEISWIGTAYLLTSTGFGPSWGRLSDIFGRKYTYMASIFFFMAGSAICGASPNIQVLIFGRAVAGLGGGGILGLAFTIIVDMVSIREAGKYSGVISGCFAIASVVGPLFGGAFTDHITWRWAYYINLPLGGCAFLVITLFLNIHRHSSSMTEKLKKIDYLGSAAILIAVILLLMGLSWGGSTYAWTSAPVLSTLIISGVMIIVFVLIEGLLAHSPIVPLYLFLNRTICAIFIGFFMFGGSFFGIIYFVPIFFQIVRGDSATAAGLELIPLVLTVALTSMISGVIISKTGIYRPFIIIGMAVGTVGLGLTLTWTSNITSGQKIGYLILAGLGFGLNVQNVVLVAQNAAEAKDLAVVTATTIFFRFLGSTVAVAIMQNIFNTVVASNLAPYTAELKISVADIQKQPALITDLPDGIREIVVDIFANAITKAFLVCITMAATSTLLFCLIENRPLKKGK